MVQNRSHPILAHWSLRGVQRSAWIFFQSGSLPSESISIQLLWNIWIHYAAFYYISCWGTRISSIQNLTDMRCKLKSTIHVPPYPTNRTRRTTYLQRFVFRFKSTTINSAYSVYLWNVEISAHFWTATFIASTPPEQAHFIQCIALLFFEKREWRYLQWHRSSGHLYAQYRYCRKEPHGMKLSAINIFRKLLNSPIRLHTTIGLFLNSPCPAT